MKFSKFSELVNRILSNNHSHRRDMDVTIVVHSPGSIGSTPSVEVQSIHAGFDWDSGKVLIFPSQPLTTLTPEQITDITDSVRKGQSWHAYQEYKKHQEQLEKLSIELDAAKQRIAELEGNRTALAVENELARKAVQAFCDVVGDNTEVIAEVVGRDGVLIFKWNETQISVRQILALTDVKPIISQRTGKNDKTHWIIFMKEATSG
ncbi:hypothetical protein ACND50_005072 [Escherichia coli]